MSLDDVPARQKSESEWLPSVCPHDCPSVCALEIERIAPDRIGKVRGSKRNAYTAGVVCAKVARYAERIHHPDRLTYAFKRKGEKGSGDWQQIGIEDALDEVAERFLAAGVDPLARTKFERTALHHAAVPREPELCRRMLSLGLDAAAVDRIGWTPLHVAAVLGNPATTEVLIEAAPVTARRSEDRSASARSRIRMDW